MARWNKYIVEFNNISLYQYWRRVFVENSECQIQFGCKNVIKLSSAFIKTHLSFYRDLRVCIFYRNFYWKWFKITVPKKTRLWTVLQGFCRRPVTEIRIQCGRFSRNPWENVKMAVSTRNFLLPFSCWMFFCARWFWGGLTIYQHGNAGIEINEILPWRDAGWFSIPNLQ